MKCPHCGDTNSRVVDTRSTGDGIRRRRQCETCHKRFTTYEHVAASLLIVKSDGRREPYDRQKLMHGILTACAKRPIPQSAIETVVDSIEEDLAALGRTEVKSTYVGSLVLEHLKQLDPMAYIRFAMVYLQMSDLEALQQHIGRILTPA
ncbi:MAG: transcriptional repressor NrdR [Anaerolineae bacterium]|nr:transcriptional repressor NrdR [Anaerolineae bacterium]MCB0199017.1 transcriptional repressor NrdR [Anaerolineae bacterium]MCB0253011.1 transcriptional repressor NrdR [Anaerolineae bacterium]